MYIITIKTARLEDEEHQYGNYELVTCTYAVKCSNMKEALEKADKYAFFQMEDEGCDFIASVNVELNIEEAMRGCLD